MLENETLWMPFYTELANKLISYKSNRPQLLQLLHTVFQQIGMKSPFVEKTSPMTDVDPFTIFGCFNKGITNANRSKILTGFAKEFQIQAAVPTVFDGVPVLHNQMAVFFAFHDDPRRKPNDIRNLWDIFSAAIDYADHPTEEGKQRFVEHFDKVRSQFGIQWNITMALFWIRPYSYVNLDAKNRQYLSSGDAFYPVRTKICENLKSVPSGAEYLGIIEQCKKAMAHEYATAKNFVALSHNAWLATSTDKPDAAYWPPLKDYNPGITKDMWITILQDKSVTTDATIKLLNMFLQLGGESTFNNLVDKYGNQFNYKGTLQEFGARVFKKVNCAPCPKEYKEFTQYITPFVGRMAFENNVKRESWKLRDELKEALIDLSGVPLYVTGEEETMDTITDIGLNTILYGPPGTGKTYHTVIYAVAIIENKELDKVKAEPYKDVLKRYNEYKALGQIEFTTFHQSYGYEEFIEGIRPAVIDESDETESGNIQYSVQPGMFKKFCEKADCPISVHARAEDLGISENATIWKVSLWSTGDNEVRTECLQNNHIRIGWDQYGKDITDKTDFSVDGGRIVLNAFISKMQIGDVVFSCYSASTIDAIGIVTGEYEWHDEYEELKRVRKVNWLVKDIRENILSINGGTSMTLASVYRLSNIAMPDVYKIINKYQPIASGHETYKDNFVFIIDEINRGNISKIFGELITLIEESKRAGKEEGMKTLLPYSMKPFGVPENVYIIGTMNTADRSIATIDTALRRRFAFKEMLPDPEVVAKISVGNLSIKEMLSRMNRRIAVLYDREHTIGHAYFMPLEKDNSIEKLAEIFKNKIIPLLQEYFYEDYEKIRLVLADNQKKDEQDQFIQRTPIKLNELFGSTDVGIDEGYTYAINEDAFMNPEAYLQI